MLTDFPKADFWKKEVILVVLSGSSVAVLVSKSNIL